jgi:hypothetical protein
MIMLVVMAMAFPAYARDVAVPPSYLSSYLDQPALVGQGRLRVMFFNVYDAELYAPRGRYQDGQALALRLTYLRAIKGSAIVKRSVEEMRRIGVRDEEKLARWATKMAAIFPDVQEGTTLTGIYRPGRATVFIRDGRRIGTIKDDQFGRAFFAIWLDQGTREPGLRAQLLGQK